MLKSLGKERDNLVREVVTIVCVHVSVYIISGGEFVKSNFKFHFIPKVHWWQLVVVLACCQNSVSGIFVSLFHLLDVFRLNDLVQFFHTFIAQFFEVYELIAFFLNGIYVIFLTFDGGFS